MRVSIVDAKARSAEIIRRAEGGEAIVLTRHGRAVANLTPAVASRKTPLVGALAGRIHIAEDFDALPDSFMVAFTGDDGTP